MSDLSHGRLSHDVEWMISDGVMDTDLHILTLNLPPALATKQRLVPSSLLSPRVTFPDPSHDLTADQTREAEVLVVFYDLHAGRGGR